MGESTVPLPGFEQRPAPLDGSGFTVFDFGVDTSFIETAAPPERASYTHDGLRHHFEVKEQIKAFFDRGEVVNPCSGACVLEPLPAELIAPPEE